MSLAHAVPVSSFSAGEKLLVGNPLGRASPQPCERQMAENFAANLCAYSEQSIHLLRPVLDFFLFFVYSRLLHAHGATRLRVELRMRSDPPRIAAGGLSQAIRRNEIIDWRWCMTSRCTYVQKCAAVQPICSLVSFNSSMYSLSLFLAYLTVILTVTAYH